MDNPTLNLKRQLSSTNDLSKASTTELKLEFQGYIKGILSKVNKSSLKLQHSGISRIFKVSLKCL